METTQEERDGAKPILEQTVRIDRQRKEAGLDRQRAALDCNPEFALRLIHDADRLAKYERDLFDERAGENRSQDTEWLRRGFLQRGAEIERLEDGIRALADELEWKYGDMGGAEEAISRESEIRLRDLLGE